MLSNSELRQLYIGIIFIHIFNISALSYAFDKYRALEIEFAIFWPLCGILYTLKLCSLPFLVQRYSTLVFVLILDVAFFLFLLYLFAADTAVVALYRLTVAVLLPSTVLSMRGVLITARDHVRPCRPPVFPEEVTWEEREKEEAGRGEGAGQSSGD
ncbi:hypothetical protein J8273_1636 [Carpediemonas membranifera]|uniref:Transmembrane protein n=1 Tax=Carpediemonas membranifera TaxID=201153 RepID=A0A8J6B8U2_9EUKA|nr:hypothetical protein J8273_1636 [Carpediemonas membranifera]|eukprot:KAG9396619.1 hypothetical protein J8273_1636 [Carpediemonas membranifera]